MARQSALSGRHSRNAARLTKHGAQLLKGHGLVPADVNSLADQHLGVDGHLKAEQAGQSSGLLADDICTDSSNTHRAR